MAKELITTANLDAYIRKDHGALFITPGRLITAGAKDELRRRKVRLIYGPEPDPAPPAPPRRDTCGTGCGTGPQAACPDGTPAGVDTLRRLATIVVTILRERYGMTDANEIETLAVKILKAVKASL